MAASLLKDRVYDRIVRLIQRGDLTDADLISHRRLAERLRVSPQPVRDALSRLEREGLVETIPRVGTRLKRVDAEHFFGLINWRIALECQIARLASEHATDEQREAMIEAGREMDAQYCGPDADEVESTRADEAFHLKIASYCGAPLLHEELTRLSIYNVKRLICEALALTRERSPTPPSTHEDIARAIASGDPGQAEQAMRNHFDHAENLYGFIKSYHNSKRKQLAARS